MPDETKITLTEDQLVGIAPPSEQLVYEPLYPGERPQWIPAANRDNNGVPLGIYTDPNTGERRRFSNIDVVGGTEANVARQAAQAAGISPQRAFEYRSATMGPDPQANAELFQDLSPTQIQTFNQAFGAGIAPFSVQNTQGAGGLFSQLTQAAGEGFGSVAQNVIDPIAQTARDNPALLFGAPLAIAALGGAFGGAGAAGGSGAAAGGAGAVPAGALSNAGIAGAGVPASIPGASIAGGTGAAAAAGGAGLLTNPIRDLAGVTTIQDTIPGLTGGGSVPTDTGGLLSRLFGGGATGGVGDLLTNSLGTLLGAFGANQSGEALDLARQQLLAGRFGPSSFAGPGGTSSFSTGTGQSGVNLGPFEEVFRQLAGLSGTATGQATNALSTLGPRDFEGNALQLLRDRARPEEEAALDRFKTGLFSSGRGAVTGAAGNEASIGGGRLAAAFAQGLGRADIDRQIQAAQLGRERAGLALAGETFAPTVASIFQGLGDQGVGSATGLGSFGLGIGNLGLNEQMARSNASLGVGSSIPATAGSPLADFFARFLAGRG